MTKIKMNWGKGLALFMGCFLVFIITLGVYMFNQTSDEYDHQYYEKGLAFDSVYNQRKQVVVDKVQPKISVEQSFLHVDFVEPAKGSIRFERLADPSLNKVIAFTSTGQNTVDIPLSGFKTGRWDLSFQWVNKGRKYLYQKQIRVQ